MASNGHRGPWPPLLAAGDPPPVTLVNPDGSSPFLLIGDHAGNVIPSALRDFGVADPDLTRHIGWDIGIAGLGERLSAMLDATFIRQTYSRLVIDCNRAPAATDAMPPVSDRTPIPGNHALMPEDRAARVDAIHEPYHRAIAETLDARDGAGRPSVLIALHSFTPALRGGAPRPWTIGVLHDRGDPGFALALLAALRRDPMQVAGDNEPYRMDRIDYTVPRHAYPARRAYAELEIRQDLLGTAADQERWARLLADQLDRVLREREDGSDSMPDDDAFRPV